MDKITIKNREFKKFSQYALAVADQLYKEYHKLPKWRFIARAQVLGGYTSASLLSQVASAMYVEAEKRAQFEDYTKEEPADGMDN